MPDICLLLASTRRTASFHRAPASSSRMSFPRAERRINLTLKLVRRYITTFNKSRAGFARNSSWQFSSWLFAFFLAFFGFFISSAMLSVVISLSELAAGIFIIADLLSSAGAFWGFHIGQYCLHLRGASKPIHNRLLSRRFSAKCLLCTAAEFVRASHRQPSILAASFYTYSVRTPKHFSGGPNFFVRAFSSLRVALNQRSAARHCLRSA